MTNDEYAHHPEWEEGVSAALHGKIRSDNPHLPGTTAHEIWDIAWTTTRERQRTTKTNSTSDK